MTFKQINDRLLWRLKILKPIQTEEILKIASADIDGSFLGFVDTYFYLSKIIPLDWTVIDFGCAYAPQSFFFRKHKRYVGVNPGITKQWGFQGSQFYHVTIKEFINSMPDKLIGRHKVFAIANNVPSDEVDLLRTEYPDIFIFYTK